MKESAGCLVRTAKIALSVTMILGLAALGYALLTASGADFVGRFVGFLALFYCAIFSPAFFFYCQVLEPRKR